MILPLNTSLVGLISNRVGTLVWGAIVESALLASSYEAKLDAVAGAEAFLDPETSSKPDTSSQQKAFLETDAHYGADP